MASFRRKLNPLIIRRPRTQCEILRRLNAFTRGSLTCQAQCGVGEISPLSRRCVFSDLWAARDSRSRVLQLYGSGRRGWKNRCSRPVEAAGARLDIIPPHPTGISAWNAHAVAGGGVTRELSWPADAAAVWPLLKRRGFRSPPPFPFASR